MNHKTNFLAAVPFLIGSVSDGETSMHEPYAHENVQVQSPTVFQEEHIVRVMSFNIRWKDQKAEEAGGSKWEERKEQVASTIRFHRADIIGLQEPLIEQINDLSEILPDYDWYGIGWNDAKKEGPIDAIFFRKSRFVLLKSSYFYLSSTPNQRSIGWDAKFPRGVTWAHLLDRKTERTFYFFNTHFDYHGNHARNNSAKLLQQKIKEIAGDANFIVTGDFNLFPVLDGEKTYEILTESLIDAQTVSQNPHHGPTGTWSGFKEAGQPGIKPDYIFVGENLQVISHGVLCDTFDGKYPSDHLPVLADLILP